MINTLHQAPLRMRPSNTFVRGFITSAVLLASGCASAFAQPISRPVPFVLSVSDTTQQSLLPTIESGPAGKHGVFHLSPGGHFTAADGTRLKFFGTELQWTANFVDGQHAKVLAKRLRKMGFNALRLNYYDYFGWDDASIFHYYDSLYQPLGSSYAVNPVHLAELDTLLFNLKEQGIYVFLPLNSAHPFSYAEGVPTWDSMAYYYPTALFYPEAATLEHAWARTALSHINPLTGIAIGKDPAIACYEAVQEKSIPFYWSLSLKRLNYVDSANAFDPTNGAKTGLQTISYAQSRRLDTLFAGYLSKKYGSDVALNAAWSGSQSVDPNNLLANGSFETYDNANWDLKSTSPARATEILHDPGYDATPAALIHVTRSDTGGGAFPVTFINGSAKLGADSLYEFSFYGKISYDAAHPLLTRTAAAVVTNRSINSLAATATLDTAWQKFSFTFRATGANPQYCGVLLTSDSGNVLFDAFVLRHVPEQGLASGESLAGATIERVNYDQMPLISRARAKDETIFYDSLERGFYDGMVRLLRDTLQCAGLVNASQTNYWGTILDHHSLERGEVTQVHTGWDYLTSRPGTQYSDSTWMLAVHTPMVRDQGFYALSLVAAGSTAGKAHVLGEWEVPTPNQSSAEQAIIPAVYAAYQDWDGIFFAPYATLRGELSSDTIVPGYISGWDDIIANHALIAQMPLASFMFRNSLVPPSDIFDTIEHDPNDVFLYPHYSDYRGPFGQEGFGYGDQAIFTAVGVRERYDAPKHQLSAQNIFSHLSGDPLYPSEDTSTSNKIAWNPTLGTFTATEPNLYAFTGFVTDSISFPKLKLERLDNSHDDLSMYYLLSSDSNSGFLSLSTRTQNMGTQWIDSSGYSNHFGHAPTIMSAANVRLTFEATLDSLIVTPLNATGLPSGQQIIAQRIGTSDRFSLTIDQLVSPSVWFKVTQLGAALAVASPLLNESSVIISPNPANASAVVNFSMPQMGRVELSILDDLGREVLSVPAYNSSSGRGQLPLDLSHFASGHYIVRVSLGGTSYWRNLSIMR